MQQKQKLF